MTEVQFAKQFLTTLDSKNTKYQSTHVFDKKTFETRVPYTLPKLPHPPHPLPPKDAAVSPTPAPGSEPASSTQRSTSTINLTLKSSRNPAFTLQLPSLPATTLISTLKEHVQSILSSSNVSSEKIKVLYNKKPIPTTKPSIYDAISSDDSTTTIPETLEFGVMVIGGASDPSPSVQTIHMQAETKNLAETEPTEAPKPEGDDASLSQAKSPEPVQPGEASGKEVLTTEEFWDDLQGFLEQRTKNTEYAKELRVLFEKAVKG